MATTAVDKPKSRSDLAQLAGPGPFSAIAMLAGVLVGYAAFTLLLSGAVAVLQSRGSQLDLSENWGELSIRGGLLLGGLLFVAYLFGGYIAGRMAWRRGAAHGVLVFLGSIFLIGVAAALLRTFTQSEDVEGITDALKSFGVPTTAEEWGNVGAVTWVATLGGMLLGSVVGGMLGQRWFTRVVSRAVDAEIDVRDRMAASTAGDDHHTRVRTGNGNGNGTDAEVEAVDVDSFTKEELYQRAQDEDIPGRSQMTKEELAAALKKHGARR